MEVDGECVDVVGDASPICGTGTYYNVGEDACFADPNVICGPGTEVEWVLDDDGVATNEFICKGTGNDVLPPNCEAAQPGGPICINGYIKYLLDPEDPSKVMETLAQFDAATLTVKVYDPLQYAVNPSVQPLGENNLVISEDGTFRVENVAVPPTGFIALVVDDDDGVGTDNYVFTGFAYEAIAGQNMENTDAYIVTADQNTTWSAEIGASNIQATGCPTAATNDNLFGCGTWVGVFGYHEGGAMTFIEGATPQSFPGPAAVAPTKAWYLNTDFETFTSGSTANHTTSTGIVFYPSARLGSYSGVCAAETSCEDESYTWDQVSGTTGGAAPNAIFVQLMEPEGFE